MSGGCLRVVLRGLVCMVYIALSHLACSSTEILVKSHPQNRRIPELGFDLDKLPLQRLETGGCGDENNGTRFRISGPLTHLGGELVSCDLPLSGSHVCLYEYLLCTYSVWLPCECVTCSLEIRLR